MSSSSARPKPRRSEDDEEDDALFKRWCSEDALEERGPPRYSHDATLQVTALVFACFHEGSTLVEPVLQKRRAADRCYLGVSRATSHKQAQARAQQAKSERSRSLVKPSQALLGLKTATTLQIQKHVPDAELAAFVQSERAAIPRDFDPALHDVFADSNPDPSVLKRKHSYAIDGWVYLKTSQGDHDYFTKLPHEPGPRMRKRPNGVSVSKIVADLKSEVPFDAPFISDRSANAAVGRFAAQHGLSDSEARRTIAEANPETRRAWEGTVDGHFDPQAYLNKWAEASARGTRAHRMLEEYMNGLPTSPTEELREAWRKFQILQTLPGFQHYTPEHAHRTELSLWYEPYDIVGQLDLLVHVPGEPPNVVDLVDWKFISGKTMAVLRKKLEGYAAQLMFYAWLIYNSPDPKLRMLRIRRMVLVALPPDDSVTTEPLTYEVVYDPAVVQQMLDMTRDALRERLKKKLRMAEEAEPDSRIERVEAAPHSEVACAARPRVVVSEQAPVDLMSLINGRRP